jgi:hypothetical protein
MVSSQSVSGYSPGNHWALDVATAPATLSIGRLRSPLRISRRPLVIAPVPGLCGAVLSSVEQANPMIATWVPAILGPIAVSRLERPAQAVARQMKRAEAECPGPSLSKRSW